MPDELPSSTTLAPDESSAESASALVSANGAAALTAIVSPHSEADMRASVLSPARVCGHDQYIHDPLSRSYARARAKRRKTCENWKCAPKRLAGHASVVHDGIDAACFARFWGGRF